MKIHQILITFFLFSLTACQQQETEYNSAQPTTPISKKIYRHSEDGKPNSLDPIKSTNNYSNMMVVNIFDTLYSYKYLKRPYELKPNLAIDMPTISDDGLTYTIKIKPNVHFSDHPAFDHGKGREVLANDFIYSIKRSFDPKQGGTGAWLWQGKIAGIDQWKDNGADYDANVIGLQATDRYTIQIKLNRPFPQLIYTLAMGFSAITPREVVEAMGQEFGSKPIGSGPFILDKFDNETAYLISNSLFRQEPIDIYFEGYDADIHQSFNLEQLHGKSPPFIDQLEIHFVRETSSRWHSFTKGNEIQYTSVPKDKQNTVILQQEPLKLQPQINENYHYSYGLEAGFVYHGFNMKDPIWGSNGDPEHDERSHALRCAIRKSHDWTQKNRAFYFGLGQVFPGIIPPSVPEFNPLLSDNSITLDINGAKQLLQANNWNSANLPTFEYHVNGSVLQKQFFEQLRGFLSKIDYPTNLIHYQPYPSFGQFNEAIQKRQAPFFFLSWTLDYPDAENTLQLFYGPNETPGSNNFNYSNPEYDRLFEQSLTMQPSAARTELYQQLNQMVIDDCVVISGLSRNKIHLWHKDVITFPDREILGGFHLKYVDIIQ